MDYNFEPIVPWNGANDTGRDVRQKLDRNFKRVGANFEEVLQDIQDLIRELQDIYLHKDREDATTYLLKLLGGTVIGGLAKFGEFITGVSGGMIDYLGRAELESLYLRSELIVSAVRYNYMTYYMGYNLITPGGGLKIKDFTDNGDGTWTVTPDLEDGMPCGQYVDDILLGYWYNKDAQSGDFAGFKKVQFRVTSVDYDAKTFVMAPRPDSGAVPYKQMKLGQTGNFTNTNRQTYMILDVRDGNNCITFYDNANTWDPEPAQAKSWFGKKKGMTVGGINCDTYSSVLQNVLLTGLIFQIDEITGQSVRVPIDKGEWVAGTYGYYNRVSHNGALWLCVDTDGTDEEPGTGNAWLKQVSEGATGEPGLSVVGGGHWEASKTPYAANTLVSFYNCVFLSKVETSNPPINIMKFSDGSFMKKSDGGYILAGRAEDMTVNEDWEMLLDGRELQGTSITFLGSFDKAPSNPSEGNSYYNTVDKCTYIWQNGQWKLMVSDGKDGRDYEYIYIRNNSVGLAPEKPESPQEDDYVPEGWTDDFLGVDADHQVEWGCKRVKRDGVWSEWSDPAIVYRWSKDGENAVLADLDNEMVGCALTSDGVAAKAQSWTTNVGIWYGYEQLELTELTAQAASGLTVNANKDTGSVTVSVAQGVALADTNDVVLTLKAQKNGQNFERTLTFTVTGVRAGANGADAIVYSLVPSVSSVSKYKDGTYSVTSVSCKRQKTVGGSIADTTDGELKYSLDGGAEQSANNGQAISTTTFNKSIKFSFYVNNLLVDVESIPLLTDGQDGTDGTSIEAVGHWESSKTPYAKGKLVNFGHGSFVSLVQTSNPPLPLLRTSGGAYLRKADGGYILAGRAEDMAVNADWQMMSWNEEPEAYWLDSPVGAFNFTSTGSPSPSSVQVTCKKSQGGTVNECSDLWLVVRRYNGSWSVAVSPQRVSKVGVAAAAGYTQYTVRAYRTQSDANAWNDAYVAEKGIGVAKDGQPGAPGAQGIMGAFPYDRGVFKQGQSYVWNEGRRDKVIYMFENTYYNFLVKNFGATVTAAPTSVTGDDNWEAMQKFESIVTDTFFADGANIGGFQFKLLGYENGVPYGEMRSQNTVSSTDSTPVLLMNTKTGKLIANDAEIRGKIYATEGEFTGKITATSGKIGGFYIRDGVLTNSYYDEGGNFVCDTEATIRLEDGGNFAAIGNHILPGILGYDAMGAFVSEKTPTPLEGSVNMALYLSAKNAQRNFAFSGYGNGVLNGVIIGYKVNIMSNLRSGAYGTDIAQGNRVLVKSVLLSNAAVCLPALSNVRSALSITTGSSFSVPFIVMNAASGVYNIKLYGRTSEVQNHDTSEYPYLRGNNFENLTGGYEMGPGDVVHVMLCYDASSGTYNAMTISRTT